MTMCDGHYLMPFGFNRLNEVAQRTLRFPITSISQHGSTICVSSQSESMSFYRFNPDTGTLDFLKSDVQSRTIHQTLMLNDNVAVGVGQSGGMVALCDNPDDLSFEKRLECLFAFHYPDVLVNPQLGLLCSQNNLEKNLLVQYLMPWNKETIIKPIVCCTVSGGLVHVYRLNPVLFRSLHALQTMLLNYEPTRPLLGSTKDFVDWYCQLSGEEKNIIHGDLIESFLKLTLTQQLSIVQMDQPICAVLMESMNELNKDNSSRNMTPTDIVHFLVDILTGFQRYY
ncbi:hypothetical protein BDB01DRAFT_420579 [Pilobolus umbonatus]|nr:hypothetical protein BDB01DRAFT_420579 [Pilobolus umbonatus]